MTVQGPDKVRTFRERRLSMSQQQDANQRPRRLSIYGSTGDEAAQPSIVTSPCPTCSCKTMGGFEPVPGGSIAKINQDRGLAIFPWQADPKVGLFGVYDGHGRLGEKVSEFVIQNLPGALKMNLGDAPIGEKDPGNALSEAYIRVDTDLRDHVDATVSGTTAVTCLMKEGHMWIANSGDSRAIVCRKVPGKPGALHAIDLTIDHKPDSPGEMKRILQMGGHVTPAGANGSPSRVWHNLRGLAMARSIGDHAAATIGVIAEPEITECAPLPVPPLRVPRHAARHGLSHRPTLFPSVGLPGACIFSACRVDVPASHLTPPRPHLTPRTPTPMQVRSRRGGLRDCDRLGWRVGAALQPDRCGHYRWCQERRRAGHVRHHRRPVVVHVEGGGGRLPRRHHRHRAAPAVDHGGDEGCGGGERGGLRQLRSVSARALALRCARARARVRVSTWNYWAWAVVDHGEVLRIGRLIRVASNVRSDSSATQSDRRTRLAATAQIAETACVPLRV